MCVSVCARYAQIQQTHKYEVLFKKKTYVVWLNVASKIVVKMNV